MLIRLGKALQGHVAAWLTLEELAALRGAAPALHRHLAPAAAPRLWRALRPAEPHRLLWRQNLTRAGAALLHAAFGFTAEDARADCNGALRCACARGRLRLAQWLAARFSLTAADARACNNDALRLACENGHLEVASWLAATFELTAADARACNNDALRLACENGH